jgi:hypothetical protein
MRLLTKSRFKLGLECPNKLYYTNNKEYSNTKKEDSFLEALAQGGFQVEELARLHYPGGKLIDEDTWEYEKAWNLTQNLLKQDNVIIYEAAFLFEGLYVKTDILVKKGNAIDLIEVKSKSFLPDDDYLFIGKSGKMLAGWKPYLFDVAFQKHVIQSCYPHWKINSFIMMADKSKTASINGLNQLFRITKKEKKRTGIISKVNTLEGTGNSVLGRKNVTEIVDDIESNKHKYNENLTFQESILLFKELYENQTYANWPTSFSACKKCEFKLTESTDTKLKSGFKECFSKQHKWGEKEFNQPNIFDIYDFRKGNKLFQDGIIFKKDLTEDNIGLKVEAEKLTTSNRQWLQIEKEINNDLSYYFDKDGLKGELEKWVFPLHFIDFETSISALPFNKGLKPYEQVAFQFSHHIYHENGIVEHANQYINNKIGEFPNFKFVRALKDALSNYDGSIFRYSHHENTILNAIYIQLKDSDEFDKEDLMSFIQTISHSKRGSAIKWSGERDMVDLWDLEKRYYYNPLTKGSNSLKEVLPASINSSPYLLKKYSQSIGEIDLTSMNFPDNHIWLKKENGNVLNPYKLLPPVFEDWTEDALVNTLSEIEGIADGGAALTTYSKMQYTDMTQAEVDALSTALYKYCELDTLAMVMVYEHFKELAYA